MRKKQFLSFFILLVLISKLLWAQALVFNHLTFRDGLPSNIVNCVYQDHTGFMWFGTNKGLCRYDGYTFVNYSHQNDITLFNVRTIHQQKDNRRYLWIGANNGLIRYDIVENAFIRIKLRRGGSGKRITDLCSDDNNCIWVAGEDGIFRFDSSAPDTAFQYKLPLRPAESGRAVTCLFVDSKKNIWAAAGMDLYLYIKGRDAFRHVILLGKKKSTIPMVISDIKEDRQGALWITTYGDGLYSYEPSGGELSHYRVSNAVPMQGRINFQKSILIDRLGVIWIATYGNGLVRFNKKNHKFNYYIKSSNNPSGISDNYLTSLFEDSQGLIWIGTLNNGVERFNRSITEITNYTLPSKKGVTAFCRDHKGQIWIGAIEKKLYRFDKVRNTFSSFKLPIKGPILRVTGIVEDDSHNFLWIATLAGGLYKFNLRSHQFSRYKLPSNGVKEKGGRKIFTLFKDSRGNIWIGWVGKEIWRINSRTGELKMFSTDWRVGAAFFEDKNGDVWIGQKEAISVYNVKYGTITSFRLPKINGQRANVYSLLRSSDGMMWVGTGKGLLSFQDSLNEQLHFYKYPSFNGRQIKTIFEDSQHTLWMSTKSGIYNFNPPANFVRKYGHEEGVGDLDFTSHCGIKTDDGTIFLGNNTGFVAFRPVQDNEISIPNVFFTNFQYANESQLVLSSLNSKIPVNRPDTIKLNWAHYTFFIGFSLDDYLMPRRNRFAYQLLGMSKEWNDLGNRHLLNFINLPPGSYTLRIKGANSAGIWNEKGAELTFVIAAPFWQRWWFRISAALFFIAAIWLAYLVRTYSIRRRNRDLEELNKKLNKQIVYREQVEKMLRDSEKKYRTLVEGIGEGIYVINKAGVFSFLNKTAAERIGGKPVDFVGRSLEQVFGKQEAQSYLKETAEVISSGKARLINTAIKLDGKLRHFRISLQPVANINGQIDQVLSIAIETTEQVTLEEQLRQAQKMEAIGKLAGGVAHDFNNLLSIIRGYTYLLLQDCPNDDPSYESLQEIEKASERAQSLTGQLLAFSRKQIIEPKVMDLNHYIREMEKMLERLIGEHIQLSTKLSPDLPPIFADSGQIEQILMNLVVNARDAMPDGGKLYIQTERIHPEQHPSIIPAEKNQNEFVVLTVRDTGIGMDDEVREKLFDPFFTTKPQGKGTGLGLSTVFGIVKQTDGYIWVNSAPGKGAEFKIYFPAVHKSLQKEAEESAPKQDLRGNEHILLVEDESGLQVMIGKMLRLYGYKVTTAGSGKEGIELFSANPRQYDMIITDVVMPDMSGIEMVSRLNEQFGDIAVLYMSGYTDDEVIRHGIVEHGISFIQKPFTPPKITQKIRRILDGKKQPA